MTRLVFVCVLLFAVAVSGQQSPTETVAGLKPAPGLAVSLFAAEPDVLNPTDLTVDERGRVWVLEGVNYRRQSRMQPDLRPEGDRIVILEDTDNDGRSDRTKVFDQGPHLRVPLGIAVLGDKVYLSQSPDLIVYTKDQNDNILRKDVVLTGFGGVDHDHGLHAVVFGPDGKLYFNHGNTGFDVTDKSGTRFVSQGTGAEAREGYFQGVALRMNLDGTNLEVISQNFRNPYELAVDSFGNVFQTDNDDDGNEMTRLKYLVEGGNYGFRGPLNRTWLEDRGTHWHTELPGVVPIVLRLGAGSPCGLLVYEGTLLPAKYRGQVFHAEAGKRILAMYTISNDGAGYRAVSEDVLNGGADTWARPSDAAVAPDGSVFVADWYDPGVGGHNMGDLEGSRGRIYRVAPTGNRPVVPALDLTSSAGLTAALASPNPTRQYLAYQAIKAQGPSAVPVLQSMWRGRDPIVRARALWLLGGLGAEGSRAIQEALKDSDPRFRILGLRVARLHGADILSTAKPLVRDASPQVRREIALLLQDPSTMLPAYLYPRQVEPPAEWLEAMTGLIAQYDGRDRWYLEALGIAARGREDAIYARMKSQNGGKISATQAGILWELRPRTALPDLVARINNASLSEADRAMALDTLGHMQWPEAARALESFITASGTPTPLVERAFHLYSHQLFSLWMDARKSPALQAVMQKGFSLPGTQSAAVTVADALGDRQYLPELLAFAKQESASPEARALAVESVATVRDAQYLKDFQSLAAAGAAPVRVAAIRAVGLLGRMGPSPGQGQPPSPPAMDPSLVVNWAQGLALSDAPNEVRVEALRLMSLSVAGLNTMLDLAEAGKVPPELVSVARNLTNNAAPPPPPGRRGQAQSPVAMRAAAAMPTDPAYVAIRARAAKILPMPSARRIPTAFELDLSYAGKAADGRRVFETDAGCAACHSLGGPRRLGPDLSKIGAKFGKQAMLDHIVNPNDAISHEYITTLLTLTSGEEVLGLITGETGGQITVQIGADQERRIRAADVKSRQESRISTMPEGLLDPLSLQQIADLLEFLATLQ
jgi:putative membrane-bound dehydrogenase-like protein